MVSFGCDSNWGCRTYYGGCQYVVVLLENWTGVCSSTKTNVEQRALIPKLMQNKPKQVQQQN